MVKYRFHGQNIDEPLSAKHNTPQWKTSLVGKLNRKTKGQVFIEEIEGRSLQAAYAWRVVDAYYSQEDSLVTIFRAYGLKGEYLPIATIGVHYNGIPHHIEGGFKYRPAHGNEYYVPVDNQFVTPNSGGYVAQVLDLAYPSEGLAFGMYKYGRQHQCLVISFRLFELEEGYPGG